MAQFDWSPDMAVGVAEIDEQHEKLVEVINALYYAYMDGKEKDVLQPLINELHEYANYHFSTEEKYMRALGASYEDLAMHREKHGEFFSQVIEFLLQYIAGKDEITPELLDYLTDWWFQHIMGVDQGLGRAIQSMDRASRPAAG